MGVPEIILIIACAAVVVGVAVVSVIRKKQGKCSGDCGGDCGGDCSHCSGCTHTHTNTQNRAKK